MPKPKLLLVTNNYPYFANGSEIMFIEPEVNYLKRVFEVTIAPIIITGHITNKHEEIVIDTTLAQSITGSKVFRIIRTILSRVFFREILTTFSNGKIPNIIDIVRYSDLFVSTQSWAKRENICTKFDLLYTFWSTGATGGLVSACPDKNVITRVHGYDVYHERSKNGYLTGFKYNMTHVKKILTISEHASRYLAQHKISESKIVIAKMGVNNQPENTASEDGCIRLVSCSGVIPLKRVESILFAVINTAKKLPQQKIIWTHLGGGELLNLLKTLAAQNGNLPNLECHFMGNLDHSDIIEYYQNNSVDLFLHASETEGLPVSMQEALSFGIPIVSTSVGGVPEIVNSETGILVDEFNPIEGISKAIIYLINNPVKLSKMRKNAILHQRLNFNMDSNYNRLLNILSVDYKL